MPRLEKGRGPWLRDGIILRSDQPNVEDWVFLRYDRERFGTKPYQIQVRYAPAGVGAARSIDLQEWTWSNGPGGAGTTIETPESNQAGASAYGRNVWLRRKGVAMPAGEVKEVYLPTLTRDFVSGQFTSGQIYGAALYLTTRNRTVVGIPYASPLYAPNEQDFGSGAQTEGLAVFAGTGTSRLYVGEFNTAIREFDGTTWRDGAAGTNRGWLETPYWTMGSKIATGDSDAGSSGFRLVGTNQYGQGMLQVAGDPKVAANWSDLQLVGNGGVVFPINRTVANNRTVWFGTGLGVLGMDGLGYSPNLTDWMKYATSINNNASMAFWDGLIWGAHQTGLFAFNPDGTRNDRITYVNFGARTGAGPIFGIPYALAPSPEGLWVGYYNGYTNESSIGILLKDDDGTYRWSMAEAVIPNQRVTFLQQATDVNGKPFLWIGTVNPSDSKLHLFYQVLPQYADPITDVENGGPFRAATDWSLRLSRFNGGTPVQKTVRRLTLEAAYLGADYPDNTVTFRLSGDDGAFVNQGTATTVRWSGTPSDGIVRATNLQVELSVHNQPTQPVQIRSASLRYSPHPELTKITTYPVLFGEGVTGQDPRTVLQRLELAQDDDPITMTDQLGRTVEVIVEPGLNEVYEEQSPEEPWIVHADVTVSTTAVVVRYDDDAQYDVGDPYS